MNRLVLLFALLSFLPSCTQSLSHRAQIENILPPPSLEPSIAESLKTPYFAQGNWPKLFWWESFNSPDLNSLIAEALKCNPSIKEIESKIRYARQEAIITRSKLFPLVFFDATDTWEHLSKNGLYKALNPNIPTNVQLIDLTLSFRYEFDFWGKNANLFKAAIGEAFAEEAESAAVTLITTTAISQAFFALKTNLVRKELYSALLHVRQSLFDLTTLMQQKALFSELSPLLSQEKKLEAEQFIADIDAEIAQNRHLINILAGKSPDALLCIDATLPPLPETLELPSHLSCDLLSRRPDLMAQIWRAKALAYRTGAAIADFFPDVNLMGFLGLESVNFKRLFQANSLTFGLQPAIHLPIFTAGAILANVNAYKAAFDEAIFAYDQLLLQSAGEVADALTLITALYQKKSMQEKVVETAKARLELTTLRKSSGLDSLFEEYALQEEVILKQLDDVMLLYNQYLMTVKLIQALGGGYEAPHVPLRAACT